VGIMSNGRMVREGTLQELITVETQTQILIENASPELLAEIRRLIGAQAGDTRLVTMGRPNTTLEKLFLESTTQSGDE
jgi:ABC-2 type transport system ATP-binding protein